MEEAAEIVGFLFSDEGGLLTGVLSAIFGSIGGIFEFIGALFSIF